MGGKLVAVEGADGVGKNTQVKLLVRHLTEKGLEVTVRSYPNYSSDYGSIIRRYLDGEKQMSLMTRFCTYMTDMVESEDQDQTLTWLAAGKWGVRDRSYLSTVAFQCAQGLNYEQAKRIEEAVALPRINLALYFKAPVAVTMKRKEAQRIGKQERRDIHERDMKLQERVAVYYRRMMSENWGADRWIMIRADKSVEEVHARVVTAVDALLVSTQRA